MRIAIYAVIVGCVVLAAARTEADIVRLKNGNHVEGIIEKETPEGVTVELDSGEDGQARDDRLLYRPGPSPTT